MLKKSLIAIAVLAVAMPCFAGTLKVHGWQSTTTYVPEKVCTIDVLIDVGYYLNVKNQDAITLTQDGTTTNYSGDYTTEILSNFDATMSVSIAAAGGAQLSKLKATITSGANVTAAGPNTMVVHIVAEGVQIDLMTAGQNGVKIADMTIFAVPAA